MNPVAKALASAFKRDFAAADREIKWTAAEEERSLWLDNDTLLVGKVDALGVNGAGESFFGEWKTLSKNKARNMATVKAQWKMSPQSLTYGVLVPEVKKFTVRWAIKTDPITTDFEWYDFTKAETKYWRTQLLLVADTIRARRKRGEIPWTTNLKSCFKYGVAYPCPFVDGCHALKFDKVPDGMQKRTESHLDIENELKAAGSINPKVVVLDATRVGDWFDCEEKYRKLWEGDGLRDDSEALQIGKEFHDEIDKHIQSFIKPQEKEWPNKLVQLQSSPQVQL